MAINPVRAIRNRNPLQEMQIIDTIREAGKSLRTVVIKYIDSTGVITDRETEPYEIKDGKYWGFCLERNQMRQFSIGNILMAELTTSKYRPRWPVKIY